MGSISIIELEWALHELLVICPSLGETRQERDSLMIVPEVPVFLKHRTLAVDIHVVDQFEETEVNERQIVTNDKFLIAKKVSKLLADRLDTSLETLLVTSLTVFTQFIVPAVVDP